MKPYKTLVWREVIWHRPFTIDSVYEAFTHIAALSSRSYIVWEARCRGGQMRYFIGTGRKSVSRVQEAFRAHGDVSFSINADGVKRMEVSHSVKLKVSKPVLSLNTDITAAMIRSTLAAMVGAKSDTESVLQIMLGASIAPSSTPTDLPAPSTNWLQLVLGNIPKATTEQRKSIRDKASQHGFEAVVRLGISGEHSKTRLHNILSAIRTLDSAGVHIHAESESPAHLNNPDIPFFFPLRLSVKETACFTLLPAGEEDLPGVSGLHPRLLLPPKWYKEPEEKTYSDRTFAVSHQYPKKRLSISPKDALEHTVLLGPSGSGKSTAMQHLILSDIRANRSVLVLDPKADLVTDILERIPEERRDDVVVIDPSDASPVGFNPLAFGKDPTQTVDAILSVFQELYSSNWGIRTADVLTGALLTLVRTKGAALLWLPQLLTDEAFRRSITSKINDPISIEPFWHHYESMRDSERRTEIAPVLNKLRQITYRPGLRNVLGQSEPKFSLIDLFYKRRIVLVPLNRGIIGAESARLLGSLIVGLTWAIALSRASIPADKRHMVSIYIDELQDYLALPTSFSDALAQARGLGVSYTVAHQYRGQLPPDIKAGIDANCRNKIVFGLNSTDAKEMAAQAPELDPLDFMTLPRYHIYTSFQSGGKSTGWIYGETLPPTKPLRMAAELKAESSKRYGVPAERTEANLIKILQRGNNAQTARNVSDTPIGRRKRKTTEVQTEQAEQNVAQNSEQDTARDSEHGTEQSVDGQRASNAPIGRRRRKSSDSDDNESNKENIS